MLINIYNPTIILQNANFVIQPTASMALKSTSSPGMYAYVKTLISNLGARAHESTHASTLVC